MSLCMNDVVGHTILWIIVVVFEISLLPSIDVMELGFTMFEATILVKMTSMDDG